MSSAPPSQRFNQQKHLGVQGWSLSQSMNPKPVTSHLLVILVTSSVLPKNDSNAYICHCPSHSWQPCCRKKKVHKNFAAQQKRVLENLNRPLLLLHCFSVWKKSLNALEGDVWRREVEGDPGQEVFAEVVGHQSGGQATPSAAATRRKWKRVWTSNLPILSCFNGSRSDH